MPAYPPRGAAPILLGKTLLFVILTGFAAWLGPLGVAKLPSAPFDSGALIDHIKQGINVWHAILARGDQAAIAMALSAVAAGVALVWGGKRALWMAGLTAPLGLLSLPLADPRLAIGGLLLIAAGLGLTAAMARWPGLALLPGPSLLLPGTTLAALHPAGVKIASFTLFPWVMALTLLLDASLHPRVYDPGSADPGGWPARLLDPRATELDRAPPGVVCEFHDIDLVDNPDGGRWAIVVAEGSGRLIAYPRGGGAPVSTPTEHSWGTYVGVVLDSDTDPNTGLTWYLDGPKKISRRRITATGWHADRALRLTHPEDHAFTLRLGEGRLALVHVNASTDSRETWLTLIGAGEPPKIRRVPLTERDGEPMRPPRHAVWLPTLGRIAVTSDFHDGLRIIDPDTGRADRLIEVPVANGAPLWSPELDRLLLPDPNRGVIRLLDVRTGEVTRTLHVDPGVRTVAVDVGRGLVLSASVLTGRVRVDRLEDNVMVDHFSGVMPMVRELALDQAAGEAYLTTWGAVYRLPYAAP